MKKFLVRNINGIVLAVVSVLITTRVSGQKVSKLSESSPAIVLPPIFYKDLLLYELELAEAEKLELLREYIKPNSDIEHLDKTIPILYAEEPNLDDPEPETESTENFNVDKRNRYHRQYSWKRHNTNERRKHWNRLYEPNKKYAYTCQPSHHDLKKLTMSLHMNHLNDLKGLNNNRFTRAIDFCDRRRSATTLLTNVRFIGKRSKK